MNGTIRTLLECTSTLGYITFITLASQSHTPTPRICVGALKSTGSMLTTCAHVNRNGRAVGAVGLTLALIFVEDDRVDPSIRSLVLFYVAGIAAMTLVINGSLSGHLVSHLHLDRWVGLMGVEGTCCSWIAAAVSLWLLCCPLSPV